MFENTNNEDIVSEQLAEAEVLTPVEYLEENKEVVEDLAEDSAEEVIPTPEAKPEPKAVSKTKKSEETIAIHSTRNVTWNGVGKVYIGYNIVTPEQAEKWLTRNHTRMATPQEVAKEFGL